MTVWELAACVDGYNKANGGERKVGAPTDAEFDALLANDPTLTAETSDGN